MENIRRLNNEHRNVDYATDVLSFPVLYKDEIENMINLLNDAKNCVSNDLKDAALLILDNVSDWLEEVYKRANGDFTNYLHR